MTKRRSFLAWLALAGCFVSTLAPAVAVLADDQPVSAAESVPDTDPEAASTSELKALQAQVRGKERSVQALDGLIDQYRARIRQQSQTAETLRGQLVLLDSLAEEQALRIRRSNEELERLALEQRRLEAVIQGEESLLAVRRALLEDLLSRLDASDAGSPLLALLGEKSLSAAFARQEDWRSLEGELADATARTKAAKDAAERDREQVRGARIAREAEVRLLEEAKRELEEQRAAKASLVAETGNREEGFRRIVADLQRQQQTEAETVTALRERLRDTLDSSDEALARGDVLLQWPIIAKKGVSAHFHDASYPFRHLFEHPGVDLPAPVGTAVRAAAGGYVAWNRTGKQYGNYAMVIHPSGIATVYAHLSSFAAKPDTYVERGEIIGFSGGRPGDPGAGLSTGPHLHFEVRQNGIPVNPELFLPEL